MKAIVVGSGIAGLASALRLKAEGHEVQIFEKNSYPGGKLGHLQLGEFRFDTGPSLFTMPTYVEDLFKMLGENPEDHFKYVKCETLCHYFFEDGTFIPFYSDEKKLLATIKEQLGIDPIPLKKHLDKSKFIYQKTHRVFLERSLHKTSSYLDLDILKAIVATPKLGIFSTMHDQNARNLNHPKLVQIFDRYATYNGSDPYRASGILNIIPHLEYGIGTYFPSEGMHSITTSLYDLAVRNGVTFHFNETVNEILVNGNKVEGILTSSGTFRSDLVFCNSDVRPAYKYLLKNIKPPKRTLEQESSSSAMIFYWGINRQFEQLDLHNIFFSADYKAEFTTLFQGKTVSDDPTIYIHISSKVVKEDAPNHGENWFVMVNVPPNNGQDWEALRKEIRKNVISKLSKALNVEIEPLIIEEDYLDPIRIEERTSSFKGALYGASSNDRMAAFFRHPNFSKVKGLYFVGGSVHPGGGIPLCLMSAQIAAEIAFKDQ
jgi:diapolycopene oxygenase